MPDGVRFSGDGTFSGVPTTAGTYGPFVFTATDSNSATANSASMSITITSSALAVDTTSLPSGIVGTPYSVVLLAAGGNLPYTWTQTSGGALPPGLNPVSTSGIISGTPTTPGSYGPYVFTVTDGANTTAASASLMITINPVAAGVCDSMGNEAALTSSKPYAFLAKGRDATGNPVDIAGSFTANGSGALTAATVDYNGFTNGPLQYQVDLTVSKYAFGSSGQGCLFLFFSGSEASAASKRAAWVPHSSHATLLRPKKSSLSAQTTSQVFSVQFSFYLGGSDGTTYHTGRIVESDSANGVGAITSGFMHLQDPNAFSVSSLASNFAFGAEGWDSQEAGYLRTAIAGSFTNAAGTLSSGFADMNVGGFPSGELTGGSGILNSSIDSTTGRGTGSYTTPTPNGPLTFDFAFYVLNASDIILLSTDSPVSVGAPPLLSGRALSANASYAAGAVNGSYMLEDTGFVSNGDVIGNRVEIGTLSATSDGTISTANSYANNVGVFGVTNYLNANFTLEAASGRVSFSGLSATPPVVYLTATGARDDAIAGFLVGTDAASSAGILANQSTGAPSFSVSSVSGNFIGSTAEGVDGQNGAFLGLFDFSGTGTYTLNSQMIGSVPVVPTAVQITVNADGSGNLDSSALSLVTNGTQIFAVPEEGDPLLFVITSSTLPD